MRTVRHSVPSAAPSSHGPGSRWVAVLLVALTVFGPLSMDLYLPVLPSLSTDLAVPTSAAQLTMTACLLGLGFGQLLAGPLSDRLGRRRPLIAGLLVYTTASLLCALSPSIQLLVVFRLVQGLAGGVGLVIAHAAGRDLYDGSRLTRYYGRIVVLSGLAAVGAPILGGLLAAVMDWRGFFVLLAIIGVVITLAVLVAFDETLAPARRVAGRLEQTWHHLRILGRDRLFLGATISSSLTSAAYFAYLAAAPFILQDMYGLSPAQFALVFALNAAGFAAFGFLAGRAAERWSEHSVFGAGLALILLGAGLLGSALVTPLTMPVTIVGFFFVSAGAAAVSPPATTLALVGYPEYAGTASSIVGLARFAAGGLAAPLVGLGGSGTMRPMAIVVLAACIAAVGVYAWLLRALADRPLRAAH